MKRILVTGGCGFIGSNFIIKQLAETDNVIGNIDALTYAGNIENLKNIESDNRNRYSFFKGDITCKKFIEETVDHFKPEALIHFAAESHVDRSIHGPMRFVETNVFGTTVLLETCYKYLRNNSDSDFRFIHVSTDEVFGSLDNTGFFHENSPYKPNSPYAASKAASDHLARAWYHTYNFPVIITNCSNNFGPYQFPEKMIPLMITNCINEKDLPVYGKGLNVRDWLYVDDHCDALNAILVNGKIGDTYNIGGNNEIKNIDLVNKICLVLDRLLPRKRGKRYSDLITFVEDRAGHDYRYAIDSSKITQDLNWVPKESFETGIEKTINWYLSNEKWWKN